MLTSMVSIWLQQGSSVQSGAIGPLFLGSQAVNCYALLFAEIYPILLHQCKNGFQFLHFQFQTPF
jgi:hypothetical protein